MTSDPKSDSVLSEKIRSLSPEAIAELGEFVDYLCRRDSDRKLVRAAGAASQESLRRVWDDSDDADYDDL